MKTLHLIFASVVIGIPLLACGMDSVVGGSCRDGYAEQGGICALVAGHDTQSGTNSGVLPGPTSSGSSSSTSTAPVPPPNQIPTVPTVPTSPPTNQPDSSTPPPPPPPLTCVAPLVACRGTCLSVDSDPQNCGACGRICPSNICVAGVCQGSTPGDVVAIGHDMSQARGGTVQAKLFANAIGIPTTEPIRVLSYEAGEAASVVTATRNIATGELSGRTVVFTTAADTMLDDTNLYASYDVVLFHSAGPSGTPFTLGQRWATPLTTFAQAGGVVVALDRGDTDMPSFLSGTGLLATGGHTPLADGATLNVVSTSDVVGAHLLSPYVALGTSNAFTGIEPPSADVTWVVRTADVAALPVAVHKIMR